MLLVPTVLMGATLPVLSHAALVRSASATRLATLYAVNTTGALAGALLTGYVFIGGLGIQRTFIAGRRREPGRGRRRLASQPAPATQSKPRQL